MTGKDPIPFRRPGRLQPEFFACADCGVIYTTKQEAASCWGQPKPCRGCGKEIPGKGSFSSCMECRGRRSAERERTKVQGATTLTHDQWAESSAEGELLTDGENFWAEWPYPDYVDEPEPYLWATTFVVAALPNRVVDDILENLSEEHHEEIINDFDAKLLYEAVEGWNAAHSKVGSWFQDETRVVLPPKWGTDGEVE